MNAARAATRPWIVPDVADVALPQRPRPVVLPPLPRPPPERPPPGHAPLEHPPLQRPQPQLAAAPGFSEAELAAAREQGLQDGLSRAAEAGAAQAAQAGRALDDIARSLRAAADAAVELGQRHAAALGGVLLQALAAAFPALEARFGPREARLLARAVLPGLLREPAVSVRVAPAALEALAKELARLPAAARAQVTIEPDEALGDADIRIGWRDGEAVRDGAAIRAAVLEALGVLAAGGPMEGNDA